MPTLQRPLIYLDHAATSALKPQALEAMLPYLNGRFGNPSAANALAREAQAAIDRARRDVAGVLNCRPADIIFTSGGTESINAALRGVAFAQQKARAGDHIVTTAIEHHAVLHTCNYLEQFGFDVTYLEVDRHGLVDPDAVAAAMTGRTALVSVMLANNEIGTVEPVAAIATAVRERAASLGRRVPFHTDAVQAPGYLSLDVDALGVDLLSLSGHKFGGPKGTGVLFIRRGTPFISQITGGGQERQRRAGTENVAGIVGQAVALVDAESTRSANVESTRHLTEALREGILGSVEDAHLNGHPSLRLPNNVNISFRGVNGDDLVSALDARGVIASAGAACGASTWEPSHVLLALGLSMEEAVGGLRLSAGPENTPEEIATAVEVIRDAVAQQRAKRGAVTL
jgi:cysteine desulfurase